VASWHAASEFSCARNTELQSSEGQPVESELASHPDLATSRKKTPVTRPPVRWCWFTECVVFQMVTPQFGNDLTRNLLPWGECQISYFLGHWS
jgi:hypothetical protein